MEPCLCAVASNLAHVRPGDLVFDPFCGTGTLLWYNHVFNFVYWYIEERVEFSGSLLIAAAHRGAFVLGADIDYQVLHGKGTLTSNLYSHSNFKCLF